MLVQTKISRWLLFISVIFCHWGLTMAGPLPHLAQKVIDSPTKFQVWVSTYVFDINKFNLIEGSYEIIFYMSFRCAPNCNQLNYELMNGEVTKQELYVNKPDYKLYRVTANLSQDLNFRKYPFEEHDLNIVVEDKFLDANHLMFYAEKSQSGLDNNLTLLGWNEKPLWSAYTVNHYYPNFQENYSRYIFSMKIKRPVLSGLLKNILPAVFIMLIGFLTLFFDAYKAVNGLAIVSGALVSMVLLYLAITASIPANDYMTFLDGFMVINYFSLTMLLAEIVMLMNAYLTLPRYAILKRFRRITPILWLILQIGNGIYFFVLH